MELSWLRARFANRRSTVPLQTLLYVCLFLGAYTYSRWGGVAPEQDAPAVDPWHEPVAAAELDGTPHLRRRLQTNDTLAPSSAPTAEPWDDGYPPDLILTKPYSESDNQWGILFHALGIIYMFAGLSLVCDEYFCAALEQMVDYWQITPDVAGATFMAAGGSAPELFTSICGVFFSESDVGFGTIVGSAVFNVLFVIGLCAVASNEVLSLTWWPLFRDCNYYIFGLGTLALFVSDSEVHAWEALILLIEYFGYVTVMAFNDQLHNFVSSCATKKGTVAPEVTVVDEKAVDTVKVMFVIKQDFWRHMKTGRRSSVAAASLKDFQERKAGNGKLKALANFVVKQQAAKRIEVKEAALKVGQGSGAAGQLAPPETGSEPDDEDDEGGPFDYPDNVPGQIVFWITLPITAWLAFTIPDCNNKFWREKWDKVFLVTFVSSLFSIMIFSYFMVWWAAIIGNVLGISDTIMGLTFLAAGTSIPDALSSVYMAKAGEGDMAVSSSIGSNVFDILVGLPFPWLIKTVLVDYGSTVSVQTPYVTVEVLLLLSMVFAVVVSISASGWELSRSLGGVMTLLYAIFLVCAIYLETNQPGSENFQW